MRARVSVCECGCERACEHVCIRAWCLGACVRSFMPVTDVVLHTSHALSGSYTTSPTVY